MRIVKRALSEQIYDTLKQDILSQRIGFGEKLVNRDLQKRFGVSSTPVRDAVNHLYLDGLIEGITNGGSRIIVLDRQFALEVSEVTAMLICTAMQKAFSQDDHRQICAQLAQALARQRAAQSREEYFQQDSRFHNTFFEFARNTHLSKLHDQYSALQDLLIRYYHSRRDERSAAMAQHTAIHEAFRDRNISLAQKYMEDHCNTVTRLF